MRRISFFDGAESETVPVIGNIKASDLVSYPDDASYEAENLGSPVKGNLYFNTVSNVIRYYTGTAWVDQADVSTTQVLENKTIDGTAATGNNIVTTDANQVTYDNTSSGLVATDVQAAVDEVEARVDEVEVDVNDIRSTTGTADGDTDMGSYSPGVNGFNLTASQSTKQNIQELVTQVDIDKFKSESNESDIADLRNTTGTSDGDTNMGSYIAGTNGFNLTPLQSTKQNIQELVDEVDSKISLSEKGAANGVAELDATGRVPAAQLPSYVDDVEEYADLASFPVTGEAGKIYTAIDTGKIYRWSGSIYVEISASEVNSVNGQTGVVLLDADDIDDAATTNKFATQAQLDKVDFISVTAPVNLDTLVSADGSIDTHSDVDTTTTPPVLDDVLKWDGSNWVPGVSSTVATLDDLTNVSAASPADGDFLRYDLANLQWENKTASLDSLSDVDAPSPNNGDILKYNNVTANWEPVADTGGTGDGGVNYIKNAEAEIDSADVTVTANITKDLETVAPLFGTQSHKFTIATTATTADYIEFDMNDVDLAITDGGKTLVVSFWYQTDANYTNDDLQVRLRNVDASSDIYLQADNDAKLYSTNGSVKRFVGRCQAVDGNNTYSLRAYVLSAPSVASVVNMDKVKVGFDQLVPGSIITEWQSYTPTLNSNTGVSLNSAQYRRVGDSLHLVGQVTYNGAGAAGAFFVTLPPGLTFDNNKITQDSNITNFGQWGWYDNAGSAASRGGFVQRYSATNELAFRRNDTSNVVDSSAFASGDRVNYNVMIPIEGWSSGAMLSTTETMLSTAKARYNTNAVQSIPNNVVTILDFEDPVYDTHNSVTTGAAWKFIAPRSGYYSVKAGIQFNTTANWSDGEIAILRMHKNDALYSQFQLLELTSPTSSYTIQLSGSDDVYLAKGDYIDVRAYQNTGAALTLDSAPQLNYISVTELPDFSTFSVYGESELVEASLAATATGLPAVATYADLVSIPLTTGEWDIDAYAVGNANAAGTMIIGISNTAGNVSPGSQGVDRFDQYINPASGTQTVSASTTKKGVIVTNPTTYYLKWYRSTAGFTSWGGKISARRVK